MATIQLFGFNAPTSDARIQYNSQGAVVTSANTYVTINIPDSVADGSSATTLYYAVGDEGIPSPTYGTQITGNTVTVTGFTSGYNVKLVFTKYVDGVLNSFGRYNIRWEGETNIHSRPTDILWYTATASQGSMSYRTLENRANNIGYVTCDKTLYNTPIGQEENTIFVRRGDDYGLGECSYKRKFSSKYSIRLCTWGSWGNDFQFYRTCPVQGKDIVYKYNSDLDEPETNTYPIQYYLPTDIEYQIQNWYNITKGPDYTIKINPPSQTFSADTDITVSISGDTDDYIFYTLDGSTPTSGSTRYTAPFTVSLNSGNTIQTVKVKLIDYGLEISDSATYKLGVIAPTISPAGGLYYTGVTVTINGHQGNDVYYTLDGSTPTSASTLYTAPFIVTSTSTVKAVAYDGTSYSDVVEETYTIKDIINKYSITCGTMDMPYIPNAWIVDIAVSRSGSYNNDSYWYITIDGSVPTVNNYWVKSSEKLLWTTDFYSPHLRIYPYHSGRESDSAVLMKRLPLPTNSDRSYDVKIATIDVDGNLTSNVAEIHTRFKYCKPTIYGGTNFMTASGIGPDNNFHNKVYYAEIAWNADPSTITEGQGTLIGTNIGMGSFASLLNENVGKAYIYETGEAGEMSDPVLVKDIKPDSVHISPATTVYTNNEAEYVDVTITTDKGSTIYYTTDGTMPTKSSTVYTQPFTVTVSVDSTKVVRAKIFPTYDGVEYEFSDEASYINRSRNLAPIILPSEGSYDENVKVEMYADENTDAIYYTLDGTTPTSASTRYTAPIYVDTTTTVKAMAYNSIYSVPDSEVVTKTYTISYPARSRRAPRASDNFNGIYVKNVTYSGIPTNLRSAYVLPSAITVTDTEADVTWGYHVDNVDEDLGDYGTRCHVNDTSITVHVEFTHGGKKYTLEKEIPCTCVVQDAVDTTDTIDIIEAHAIVTLENQLRVVVKARVKHTEEETVYIVSNLSNYSLSGSCDNGNFMCEKEGSYFVYDDILTLNYSGQTHQANDVELTLLNSNGNELDHHVIQVTFQAGSIFDVRDDAIRMAVQSAITYTDGEISGVTNHLSQLEINISGITGTVSSITNTVSGISADVSQLQQTASSLTSEIYNISGDMVTHSELAQTASSITAQVVDEVGEITGMFISAGTITLDASKTIITGQLSVDDGIAFYDDNGNLAVTVDGDDIGTYAQQSNGSIAYKYVYHSEANTTGYQFTTNKEAIGQYKSGDTISFNYLAEWCTLTPNGNGTATWDTASANTMQVQLYVGNASEPFSSTTVTLTGDTTSPMRTRKGSPICEFTIPSDGTVYVKYAFTSSASSQVGTRSAQVSAQIGFSDANAVKIGKGGASLAHAANYLTYLGAEDTVLRKGTTGIKYGTWGTDQYNMRTGLQIAASTYHLSSGEFSEHPDNLSADTRIYWTPMYNYTPHTQATYCCDVYYGQITGYEGYGDKYNARVREDKLYGDLWLDYLVNGSGDDIRGERIFVLLPPTTRQVVVDNKVAFHSLPEGYTVRIHNMGFYNGVYIAPNLMDGHSVSEGVFYLPNGTRETNIYFNANDTFIELVYAGTYTLSDLGMRQLWYVRNQNNV